MSLRAIIHLALHVVVPGLVAWRWFSSRPGAGAGFQASKSFQTSGSFQASGSFQTSMFWRAWLVLLLGWVIDLDHLLADPVYAPDRCSIGFHPLHTAPAIAAYAALTIPRPTRLFGIGLLIHIGLDLIDCLWMRHAGG